MSSATASLSAVPPAAAITRYVARQGSDAKAADARRTADHGEHTKQPRWPIEVFDGWRNGLAANRAQFYREIATGSFYRLNRPGAKLMDGAIGNWQRPAMMGGAGAHYDGIKAF